MHKLDIGRQREHDIIFALLELLLIIAGCEVKYYCDTAEKIFD